MSYPRKAPAPPRPLPAPAAPRPARASDGSSRPLPGPGPTRARTGDLGPAAPPHSAQPWPALRLPTSAGDTAPRPQSEGGGASAGDDAAAPAAALRSPPRPAPAGPALRPGPRALPSVRAGAVPGPHLARPAPLRALLGRAAERSPPAPPPQVSRGRAGRAGGTPPPPRLPGLGPGGTQGTGSARVRVALRRGEKLPCGQGLTAAPSPPLCAARGLLSWCGCRSAAPGRRCAPAGPTPGCGDGRAARRTSCEGTRWPLPEGYGRRPWRPPAAALPGAGNSVEGAVGPRRVPAACCGGGRGRVPGVVGRWRAPPVPAEGRGRGCTSNKGAAPRG